MLLAPPSGSTDERGRYRLGRMSWLLGPLALVIGVAYAIAWGLLCALAEGALLLAWPFAWAFDAIRRRLPRRAPKPR